MLLIAIDIEQEDFIFTQEKKDGRKERKVKKVISQIGIALLDVDQVQSVAPGINGRNWYSSIKGPNFYTKKLEYRDQSRSYVPHGRRYAGGWVVACENLGDMVAKAHAYLLQNGQEPLRGLAAPGTSDGNLNGVSGPVRPAQQQQQQQQQSSAVDAEEEEEEEILPTLQPQLLDVAEIPHPTPFSLETYLYHLGHCCPDKLSFKKCPEFDKCIGAGRFVPCPYFSRFLDDAAQRCTMGRLHPGKMHTKKHKVAVDEKTDCGDPSCYKSCLYVHVVLSCGHMIDGTNAYNGLCPNWGCRFGHDSPEVRKEVERMRKEEVADRQLVRAAFGAAIQAQRDTNRRLNGQ